MENENCVIVDGIKIPLPAYNAWRRREAYAIPMTEEGQRRATERLMEFSVGYSYGIRAAAAELENLHRKNKKDHSFFLKAANAVRGLLNVNGVKP